MPFGFCWWIHAWFGWRTRLVLQFQRFGEEPFETLFLIWKPINLSVACLGRVLIACSVLPTRWWRVWQPILPNFDREKPWDKKGIRPMQTLEAGLVKRITTVFDDNVTDHIGTLPVLTSTGKEVLLCPNGWFPIFGGYDLSTITSTF